jgi:hypothetical protein
MNFQNKTVIYKPVNQGCSLAIPNHDKAISVMASYLSIKTIKGASHESQSSHAESQPLILPINSVLYEWLLYILGAHNYLTQDSCSNIKLKLAAGWQTETKTLLSRA